ncbi:Lon protease family protein [Oceanisphaera avium]|uniref:endopeptidase La n=1 Tax=Oceanisphaera avium TaxID=1903694 RepID=A0A1Y0CVH1_9GAMM|nr:Lon protease family protein [Oceanisphaera avium]ART79331.1 peptidase S16 [Oceanisphaera avium]
MQPLSPAELNPVFNLPPLHLLSELPVQSFSRLQDRADSAFATLSALKAINPILLLNGFGGVDYEELVHDLVAKHANHANLFDLCYAENLTHPQKPIWLKLKAGSGLVFCELVGQLLELSSRHLDAEHVVERILKKQDQNPKIAHYLSLLSQHVASGEGFSHPVLINLMVHRSDNTMPIVYARQFTPEQLFGAVHFQTEQGSIFSHHHLLEPGLIHQANGGYLIVPIEELLEQPNLWFRLKNALITRQIEWSRPAEMAAFYFQPEAPPLDIHLILVGDRLAVAELYLLDRELDTLAFLRADILPEWDAQQDLPAYLSWIGHLCHKHQLLDLDKSGVERLCRYSSRLTDHQHRLSLVEAQLVAMLQLADVIARREQHTLINASHIMQAQQEQDYRLSYLVEQTDLGVRDGQYLMQTQGQAVGQINGLSVIQITGHPYDFGEPVRLTATVHLGDGDVSDIERKAELAGHIHAKAMMIIHGYLANLFGAEHPSPLSANLVFEQSYHEIDGDSASLTGLCALLSALAKEPIYQHFAVTGALDQFGNVEPVGGVNEKIEGFYRLCKLQGLTGKQGIILPLSNRLQLNLSDEVAAAVSAGQFHIYPVAHVVQAIELLTGCEAGDIEQADTLFGRIRERLDELNGHGVEHGFFRRWFQR